MSFTTNSFRTIIIASFIFLFSSTSTQAQFGTIKGFVYEKESGEPIIFTNVFLKKTAIGGTTDVNGYFVISKIPPGNYTLMVTYLGYDSVVMPISIKANEVLTKKLILTKGAYNLDVINISADREEARQETKTSVTKVTPKQLKQIPSIGGQPDLAQYLQVIPGVVFTGDQGGQLYIRGGSPIQNKVLLDGMVIYNPFHSIGLFSVFETDIIRNADVYTGGFGAEYGDRVSSVMDITTRDGSKKRFGGKFSSSTFGANILLEGPLSKEKNNNSNSTSFIISAKNSYLAESSKLFYKYIDTAGLPFNFTDLYAKLSFNGANGSKLNLFGFNFNDNVKNYQALADFNWKTTGLGANFVVVPGSSSVLMEGIVAYSDYKITMEDKDNLPKQSEISGFNMGLDFTYFLGKDQFKYGLELQGFKTDYTFYNAVKRELRQSESTTEIAGYFKYKSTVGKFLFEPSIRFQYYASLSEMSIEPRYAMKFLVSDKIRLKLATGIYSQNLIDAKSDRDVVNLFYGFLSGPDNLPEKYKGQEITSKLQKAQHAIFGIEYDIIKHVTINLEGYYKNFSQLSNINRNKIFDDVDPYNVKIINGVANPLYKPDYLRKDFIIETGNAYGVDFSMKYDYKRVYIWAVYSLGYVNRSDELQDYVPHYDRRHNVNLLLSYVIGAKLDWEFNIRWNYGSGFPFTKVTGNYEKLNFSDINQNITTTNGEIGTLYDELNTGRLPEYHRLDFTLKKKFEIAKNSTLELNVSVTNAYDRDNLFYFNTLRKERVNQLPFMPSFGLNLTF
ncbi:MAG: TonB-dependent receptor [Bacteroidetes bacterium]|nr:TonB-dependent receptor [Bacteroidota bacterium]